eukprot:TRINITY_DN9655_c0_g1_i1.p1 TRINITY_DN9655_c0_g1~~TRINITY_DN9655_c0_g1_i1.p1  ORF type:complete len:355 (+),score=178.57 TRINITY_DN9655_c0_g1_i1:150-1214(+)
MADDPFEEEFGISIEEMGFDPREIRSQEAFDALTDEQRNLFANIRYESSLAPEERKKIADKRKKKKEEEGKKKEAEKATTERREVEEKRMLVADTKNIFIPIWEGFDQLCFSTMYDVFKAAGFHVLVGVIRPPRVLPPTPAEEAAGKQVRTKSGVFVSGDFLFEFRGNHNFNQFDAVVVPSGDGVQTLLLGNKKLCSLIKGLAWRKKFVCGVEDVPGSLLLRLGVLHERKCTGSDRSEEEITHSVPPELGQDVTFTKDAAVVMDGPLITCRSAADSQECALVVLGNLGGAKLMEQIAGRLGYEGLVERVKKNIADPPKPKPKGKKGVKTAKGEAKAAEEADKGEPAEEEEDELS